MTSRRKQLINCFNSLSVSGSAPSSFLSVSEWVEQGRPENQWMAGRLLVSSSGQYFLQDHRYKVLLQDIDGNESVFSGSWNANEFFVQDLRSGDKVAFINRGQTSAKIGLLSVNEHSEDGHCASPLETWKQEERWLKFLSSVESFFIKKKFYQAQTPFLVICPGLEPTLEPFSVQFEFGAYKKKLFLPTSPELHLKKILSEGVSSLFEIKTCFRNKELGFQHQPEFQMLEWYRAYKTLDHLVEDIHELIHALGSLQPQFQDPIINKTTMKNLFQVHLNFCLTPETTQKELLALAQSLNLRVDDTDSWDDLFFLVFIDKIEPHLGQGEITFVFDYPPSQAALAKINSRGWADRFEMYWQGYEIANAFNELTCPRQQLERFQKEQKNRKKLNKEYIPIDEEFIKSLQLGLPPSVGIALGLERLYMAMNSIKDIGQLKHFPLRMNKEQS